MNYLYPMVLGDRRVLAPGRLRPLRALAWMALLLVVLSAILSLQALSRQLLHAGDAGVLAMAFIVTVLAYAGYAVLVHWGEQRPASEIAWRRLPAEWGLGLLLGGACMSVLVLLLYGCGLYSIAPGHWDDWPHDLREAIGTGLLEELLFRAVAFRLLVRAFGTVPGLLLSAVLFGGAHLANPHASVWSALAIAVEAGLMLGSLYLVSGRIWLSAGVHAGWNLFQGGVFGAAVSGQNVAGSAWISAPLPGVSPLLSGGGFGPEGSLPAVLIGLLVFAAAMRHGRRWRQPGR